MTTITIENRQALSRTKFENITGLQDYLFSIQKEKVLKSTDEINTILD
jgi:ABC-type ATPase with predicted acetyltransferase domain